MSVEAGGLSADDVRTLNRVRKRASAEIALFLSLETPTKGMIADAASAGFYTSASHELSPRVQLHTMEGLLSATHGAEHPDHQPGLNFKKAKTETNAAQKDLTGAPGRADSGRAGSEFVAPAQASNPSCSIAVRDFPGSVWRMICQPRAAPAATFSGRSSRYKISAPRLPVICSKAS